MGTEAVSSAPAPAQAPAAPITVSPPLAIDSQQIYSAVSGNKQKNIIFKLLDLLKGARPGTDLTSFQVPAQVNMPKSQLQLYGEQVYCCGQNLMELCAEGATPMERFLAVVRWHLSLIRPVPFAKVPFNPILGETHHVTAGNLNVISEQVSHHPPVSALFATNTKKQIEVFQWNLSEPKYYGNSVVVSVSGQRTITLLEHGETYELGRAKLKTRFWPGAGAEWTGDTIVRCAQTGLEATVSFESRSFFSRGSNNRVSGTIYRTSAPQKTLYKLSGAWDETVTLEDTSSGKKTVLYDGKTALSGLKTSVVPSPEVLSEMESVVVWNKVTKGVWEQDWDVARDAKASLEDEQRALREERAKAGQTWQPKYFSATADGGWVWALKGQAVPPGPITI